MNRLIAIAIPLALWAAGCVVVAGMPLAGLYALLSVLPEHIPLPALIFDPVWGLLEALGQTPTRYDQVQLPGTWVLEPLLYSALVSCAILFVLLLVSHVLMPLRWQLRAKGAVVRIKADTAIHASLAEIAGRNKQRMPTLWMLASPEINAWAFSAPGGRRAVVFTSGLLKALPGKQVCWVFAHELGHLAHGDTAGSGVWAAGVAFMRMIDRLRTSFVNVVLDTMARIPILYALVFPLWLAAHLAIGLTRTTERVLHGVLVALTSVWNRRAEFRADAYAASLMGAAPGIALLERLSLNGTPALADLLGSHPSHVRRMERLMQRNEPKPNDDKQAATG